ncbi:MAG: hypothetical protein KAR83_01030 [Thermodesulfovibrionales bacterium]|nr:hypothetical protein [Thermodesulfovibrionales bacterium]
MKRRTGAFSYFSAVFLVALLAVCFSLAPALSQEQEDVYIEGDQSHFKMEKGKRYHGKWTSEKPSAEPSPQPEMSKEQATEPPPSAEEPGPVQEPEPEPEPEQEQMPAPEAEKEKPAESAAYEKLQSAVQPEEGAASSGAGPAAGLEISDQPGVLACKYMGLAYEDGRAVVRLLFTNNSDKDIQGIWGGFEIKDMAGKMLDATGVTDTVSLIKPGEDSSLTLFRFLELDADALNALKGASGKVELVFGVDSVGFTDGSKVEF